MTKEHKEIIYKNRQALIDNMEPDNVIKLLRGWNVLSSDIVSMISANTSLEEQVKCLLDKLSKRPDTAFDALIKALEETDQEHLSELLKGCSGTLVLIIFN